MNQFYTSTLPTLINFLPLAMFATFRIIIKKRIRQKVVISGIIFLILGILAPFISTIICANGMAANIPVGQPKCVTGAVFYFFWGILLNLFCIPILGLIFFLSKKKGE